MAVREQVAKVIDGQVVVQTSSPELAIVGKQDQTVRLLHKYSNSRRHTLLGSHRATGVSLPTDITIRYSAYFVSSVWCPPDCHNYIVR